MMERPGEAAPSAGVPERRWPTVRPRDAATLVILDRSGPEPRVLMGKRHPGHVFMPGKFVFPGGRVEGGDRRAPAIGSLNPHAETALRHRVNRPSASLGRALALAAIRETFEETGLLLGTRHPGPGDPLPGPWAAFARYGVRPDLGSLDFVARAITPPGRPRRFDTRFFAVDSRWIAHEAGGAVGPDAELVELAWVPLGGAADLDLSSITLTILGEITARLRAGFGPELPVPFHHERRGRRVRELLPAGAALTSAP